MSPVDPSVPSPPSPSTSPSDVLEDEWVLVPVLQAGTPVESVTVDNQPVQLIADAAGLGWATNARGWSVTRCTGPANSMSRRSVPTPSRWISCREA